MYVRETGRVKHVCLVRGPPRPEPTRNYGERAGLGMSPLRSASRISEARYSTVNPV